MEACCKQPHRVINFYITSRLQHLLLNFQSHTKGSPSFSNNILDIIITVSTIHGYSKLN